MHSPPSEGSTSGTFIFLTVIKVKIHFSAKDSSNRHKFAAGLIYAPNFVSSFTTLITLSLLKCISVYFDNNQLDRGIFLQLIRTYPNITGYYQKLQKYIEIRTT